MLHEMPRMVTEIPVVLTLATVVPVLFAACPPPPVRRIQIVFSVGLHSWSAHHSSSCCLIALFTDLLTY